MTKPEEFYDGIVSACTSEPHVEAGKMMSSPGIKYRNKVFAFFHKGSMTFKMGEAFAPTEVGIEEYGFLSPFKTKPPLKGWFVIGERYMEKWPLLTEMALDRIKRELG